MAAAVVGAIDIAIPAPPTSSAGRMSQKFECRSSWPKITSEPATRVMPARDQPARPEAVADLPGDRREEDDAERHRQEGRARLGRRVAEDVLDEQRDVEEDAEHRECDEQHDPVRAREGRVAEEREVEHRHALAQLEQHERGERRPPRWRSSARIRADVQPYVFASISP